ncbi:lipocalin family protein [Pleionea sediminis]|uniref:lipocalin family protein n=1 Tax=Pleionea sediminis TaxID=2569479 RepID=UPI001185F2E6|nr:lipocalin family protein [Pleionea sediminis]
MKNLFALVVVLAAINAKPLEARWLPEVVDNFDVNLYLGRWYEVASTKPVFQNNCLCTTADYTINENGNVGVFNSCRLGAFYGPVNNVRGEAVQSRRNPAKLRVGFGGLDLPFNNYWVVDLADDYRYAVVSSAFRNPIFILSRTPEIAEDDLNGILQRLEERNFNVDNILPTQQPGCSYPPFNGDQ